MSHPFRDSAAAVVDSAFAAWGDEGRYTSADGVTVDTVAIVKTADIVALAPRQRARQVGRTLELKRTDIVARPTKGARVEIGSLTYTILDDAKSEDALCLVWTCRVSMVSGRAASVAFVLAAPLCVATAELGARPNTGAVNWTLDAPTVFATAFVPVTAASAVLLPAPSVVATAIVTAGRAASLDCTLPAPSLVASASAGVVAGAAIILPPPGVAAAASLTLATVNALTLPAPTVVASAVARVSASATPTLAAPVAAGVARASSSAALAVTLPAPAVSATVLLSSGRIAEAAVTLPAPVASGASVATLTASAAPSLPAPSVAATAAVGVLPYAGITLPAPTVAASAVAAVAGSAAVSLPAPTVSAAASLAVATVNAITLPAPVASGVSTVALGAALAFTLPAPAVAAAASVALAPAAAVNVPGLTLSADAVAAIMASASLTLDAPSVVATATVETSVSYKTLTYVGGKAGNFVGATSGNTNVALGSGLSGGIASAVSAGDLVIVAYATGSKADRTLAIGDGTTAYTLVGSELYANGTTNDANLRVAYKFMGGSPDANVVLGPSGNAADGAGYAVHVWRNVDAVTPLDVTPTTATGTATSRPNPPAITPTTPGAVIIAATGGAAATGTTAFAFSGASNLVQDNGADTQDGRASLASYAWTSGALDPAASSAGSNNAADSWAAITFALRPAVDTGSPPVTFPVVSARSVPDYQTGTAVVNKPTGTVSGDLLVAAVITLGDNGTVPVTPPSGWTQQGTKAGVNGHMGIAYFTKIAGGSEPSTYSFVHTLGGNLALHISRIDTGTFDAADPVNGVATAATQGATRAVTAFSTSKGNCLLLLHSGGYQSVDTVGAIPSGWTLQDRWTIDGGDYYFSLSATRELASAGTTGTGGHAQAVYDQFCMGLIAINPAP